MGNQTHLILLELESNNAVFPIFRKQFWKPSIELHCTKKILIDRHVFAQLEVEGTA